MTISKSITKIPKDIASLASVLFLAHNFVFSQTLEKKTPALPFNQVVLEDLSFFKSPGKNWQIVGNVFADRSKEQSLESMSGKGVLANLSDAENRGHLFTKLEHGDMELEVDVLMPAGSNSGLYFQGRYEVQLMDSWGESKLKYSDLGGIYQRTDTITNKGFEGHAPLVNASKAPGLWQHLKILFRAPKFDAAGKKTANAKFEKVYLNGILIQDGVEVSGPTRSGAFNDEKPVGPLMIQGNHGRVAFRNMAYKIYGNQRVTFQDLYLKEYKSPGDSLTKLRIDNVVNASKVDTLSYLSGTQKEIFLLNYEGKIAFPKSGEYLFKLQAGGGGMLVIGKDTLILHEGVHGFEEEVVGSYNAKSGSVPFRLVYNRPIGWRKGLTLNVEGPGIVLSPLHAPGSVFLEPKVESIILEPNYGKAVIQRTFMEDGDQKRTHCLSVGTPEKINFTVDLATGELFQAWSGNFLDVTSMWHRRGNQQLGTPLGPVLKFNESVGATSRTTPLVNNSEEVVKFVEYRVDGRGLPTFFYTISGLEVQDKLTPSSTQRSLSRQLVITASSDFAYRLASGSAIELLPDGAYAINGKEYYLVLETPGLKPIVKKTNTGEELVISGKGKQEVVYSLIW